MIDQSQNLRGPRCPFSKCRNIPFRPGDVPLTLKRRGQNSEVKKKTLGYIILGLKKDFTYSLVGALPLGDWIRGIRSSSRSNMPIKGNSREDRLLPFLSKWNSFTIYGKGKIQCQCNPQWSLGHKGSTINHLGGRGPGFFFFFFFWTFSDQFFFKHALNNFFFQFWPRPPDD